MRQQQYLKRVVLYISYTLLIADEVNVVNESRSMKCHVEDCVIVIVTYYMTSVFHRLSMLSKSCLGTDSAYLLIEDVVDIRRLEIASLPDYIE